ncbi:unnamed protein product [Sphagnum compactum]
MQMRWSPAIVWSRNGPQMIYSCDTSTSPTSLSRSRISRFRWSSFTCEEVVDFPYIWVLVQFGAFIVLCGATHLINLWTFSAHTRVVAVVLTVAKIFTAVVSCATSLMLHTRQEHDTQDHARRVRQDSLEECNLWMPSRNGQELQLSHMLRQTLDTAAGPVTVPIHHITIKQVFSSNRTVVISPNSPVCISRPRQGKYAIGDVVAVRVPLLHLTTFHHADWPDSNKQPFALIVLMLPSDNARRWHFYELELVEVVADQVQDTGVGLNPHAIPKLFNKFVNLMDGHIWVESEGIGKGTLDTFVVKLGLPEHSSELDHQMATVMQPGHLRTDFMGVRVLVTDDNGVNRMVTRGLLMRLGSEVSVVSSGQECLQVISQPGQSFNVLLLDVCMPDMDGYEVAIHIQEKFAWHEHPQLVALTSNTDMATREWCLSLGMDRVILKPISLEKMRMVLTELLGFGSLNDNHWRT